MQYQKIINLLDNTLNQPSKFKTKKNGTKLMMNHGERITKIMKLDLKLQR